MKGVNKNLFKKFGQIKRIYKISTSLSLFIATLFLTISIVFLLENETLNELPITIFDYQTSIDKLDYHRDGSLVKNVEKYRNLYKKEIDQEQSFQEYSVPEPTVIYIDIEDIYDIDENNSTVVVGGYVEAEWFDNSIKNFAGKDNTLHKKTKEDVLSTSFMNFYDAENQLYEKVILRNEGDSKFSKYRFKGKFRLYRDLRKFPFDNAHLRIEVINELLAPDIQVFTNIDSTVSEESFRFNSYLNVKEICYDGDTKKDASYFCLRDELTPRIQGKSLIRIFNVSDEFIEVYDQLNYAPSAVINLFLKRSIPSGFFRYLLPLLFGIGVLIFTENLSSKYQEIKVATPPTVLLTFIFMQSGYQADIPQLSYLTYIDKLYLVCYFLAILELGNALIYVGQRNKINRLTIKLIGIKFEKLSRIIFISTVIFSPLILFLTS